MNEITYSAADWTAQHTWDRADRIVVELAGRQVTICNRVDNRGESYLDVAIGEGGLMIQPRGFNAVHVYATK